MRAAVLVFLLLAAPSNGSSPTALKTSQEIQQQARTNQSEARHDHGSPDSNTPAIRQTGTRVTIGDQRQPGQQGDRKPPRDWWALANTGAVTLFTLALAILAYCQWRAMRKQATLMHVQARLMQKQLGEMETTSVDMGKLATAAKLSADTAKRALETLERADVLVEAIKLVVDGNAYPLERGHRGQHITRHTFCVVTLKNYGRTRAETMLVDCGMVTEPMDPKRYEKMSVMEVPAMLGAGVSVDVRFPEFDRGFSATWIEHVNAGAANLFVAVDIIYHDVFGNLHSIKCHGDFHPASGTFALTHQEIANEEKADT